MDCNSEEPDRETTDTDRHAELFSSVFGDTGSEDDGDDDDVFGSEDEGLSEERESRRSHQWVKVNAVEGLWHCSQFLSAQQQDSLTKAIAAGQPEAICVDAHRIVCFREVESLDSEGWFSHPQHNQVRDDKLCRNKVGCARDSCGDLDVGPVASLLPVPSIRAYRSGTDFKQSREEIEGSLAPLPRQILEREPLFDQMIANSYQPGEGIRAHVDLMRFEDGIAIVSLLSTCIMTFALLRDSAPSPEEVSTSEQLEIDLPVHGTANPSPCLSLREQQLQQQEVSFVRERDKSGLAKKVDLLLKPGDLIVTYGPARYLWTHEIDRSKDEQVWLGQKIEQQQRISVTLRKLCPERDTD
ncbi:hypothetical protein AXG93_4280s1160 [Marchantia polymorpha subsp. ruderalis]|uniref:Alpha-ketoglutarate-dependent dioxygenase AlkB-like domain-containing protein n=1 Tax=Marchantia polymorpha subsp. ruderalis TaxID=1480154 RepID=A0A176WLM8_MARPO|nr:hypothetical protein AXG93_4280s1160 [Marchantia polymorpha subsp. ruderalis]